MKKLLLAFIITLFYAGSVLGQGNYDLDFNFIFKERKGADTITKQEGDTLVTHKKYDLGGTILNNGPEAFTGSLKFRIAVYDSAAGKTPDFPPKFTTYEIAQAIGPFTIQPNSVAKFFIPGAIDVTNDFRADTMNIVIIWPSEGYADMDTGNDYSRLGFYVVEGVNSIRKPEAFSGVSIYPNPAKNTVQISFESVRRGELLISDISGKVLIKQQVAAGKQKLNIPLNANGSALAEGMYFITLQTAESRSVHKLQVVR